MKGKINLSFRSVKMPKMFYRYILWLSKKSRRTSSVFVIYSYFKDGELTAVKRNTLLTRYVKGVPFVKNEI